jgi:hypothetical protein
LFVVVAALLGNYLGIQGVIDKGWFWFGNQGLSYIQLGRFWQILFFVALLSWSGLNVPALCVRLGLDDGEVSEAMSSKARYASARLAKLPIDRLIAVARALLEETDDFALREVTDRIAERDTPPISDLTAPRARSSAASWSTASAKIIGAASDARISISRARLRLTPSRSRWSAAAARIRSTAESNSMATPKRKYSGAAATRARLAEASPGTISLDGATM